MVFMSSMHYPVPPKGYLPTRVEMHFSRRLCNSDNALMLHYLILRLDGVAFHE